MHSSKERNLDMAKRAVVVTTAHRGVFFGYLPDGAKKNGKIVELKSARMCVYWSADVHGVLGLASAGPSASCKIGPAVPSLVLQDVTAVVDASSEAVKKWEAQPWR